MEKYYAKITDYINCFKRIMSEEAAKGRPMKYPYTLSAKIAQFPFKYYFNNQWIWRYGAFACLICLPVFYKITKLANTPENVAKWKEIRRKEAEGHH